MSRVDELQLSEICLSLQSEEKSKRLKALEKLRSIISNEEKQWSKDEISEIWQIMNKHLVKGITDPTEACRDSAVNIIKMFIHLLPAHEKNIIYIIPILVRRLGSQEILEPAEEVRLSCVTLIRLIIDIYKEHIAVYINDFIAILSKTVTDSYPKIKQESCEAIAELAQSIPMQFYSQCEPVIKPILSNFTHQHHRVRVASVKAIGQVIQYGHSKHMEDVATPLAERLFDQSGTVRTAVIEVAGGWLLHLRDKYSWWYKLLPLLLTGLHDEILDIRVKAQDLWDAAGRVYLEENESNEKIKDKMDFLTQDPDHYPSHIERPNLGCRIIVQQNIGKLVGAIAMELSDWKADIRVRSAQLLAVLTLNAEQDITQHVEKLLPAMYRACNDEDSRVAENVILAAEYIGYFVPPETYCKLLLPTLDDGNIRAGHLAVFAAILRGSLGKALVDKLQNIGDFLEQPHICQSKNTSYQYQILRCCEALFTVCQEDCNMIANSLFIVICTVWSMTQQEDHKDFARHLMATLVNLTQSKDFEDLYSRHLPRVLSIIQDTSSNWSVYSAEVYIFKLCLTEARTAAAKNISLILPILKATIHKNSDPELRLKMFILLSDFFSHRNETLSAMENPSAFIKEFLEDILISELIWSAGKTSEAIRTAAVGCLCALLDELTANDSSIPNFRFNLEQPARQSEDNEYIQYFAHESDFMEVFDKLRPILLSLIDDNARKTRLYALRALCLIINAGVKLSCITDEDVIAMYPAVIKRLDDGSDDVRNAAVEALVFVWRALSRDYDLEFGKSHVDYLYTTMIIHLDDPEKSFQDLMLEALMELAVVHPEMLADKIIKSQNNFRNQEGLDKLLKQCQSLLKIKN